VGRTGPCTREILAAGIAHVVVGQRDPNPLVAGGGLRALRRAGVQVESGVLETECRRQHRGFLSVCERGRPFVVLKLATTLDGRIATASGESRWITGPAARAFVHALRARSDAVMVGSRTVRADDPALTVRRGTQVLRRPLRVVVDGALSLSPRARVVADGHADRTVLLHARDAAPARVRRLAATGARLLPLRRRGAHVDLRAGLRALARIGVCELLVEGGGVLAAALLRERLVDELHWILAPCLLGADGLPGLGPLGVSRLSRAPRLGIERVRRFDSGDWHVVAHPIDGVQAESPRRRPHGRAG
jgi:diaminohydroxyphosphoribosylaminopyrimidine deaminase/5-amino-6-(5-phosphoribosylamino)uracil reductase